MTLVHLNLQVYLESATYIPHFFSWSKEKYRIISVTGSTVYNKLQPVDVGSMSLSLEDLETGI
jgi:hypothetical protein